MTMTWKGFTLEIHRQDVKDLIKEETFVPEPVRPRKKYKPRAGYPGKCKIFTKEEILQISTTLKRRKS